MFAVSLWYSVIHRTPHALSIILGSLLFVACGGGGGEGGASTSAQATGTPGTEQAVGERLFVETRFAQSFKAFLNAGGNVNAKYRGPRRQYVGNNRRTNRSGSFQRHVHELPDLSYR